MSKYTNVNPGQYKVRGREKPDVIAKERMKTSRQEVEQAQAQLKRRGKKPARSRPVGRS